MLRALDEGLAAFDAQARLTPKEASAILHETAARAGVKGRALYHPIRLALTGTESGPELAALLTLLPTDNLRRRIQTALDIISPSNHKE